MLITIEKAVDGFIGFMADQVASIPKDIERWKGFALLGMLKSKPRAALDALKPMMEKIGLLHNGMVDLDVLKSALDMAFNNVPEVEFFNFKFSAEDSKALFEKMRMVAETADAEVQA